MTSKLKYLILVLIFAVLPIVTASSESYEEREFKNCYQILVLDDLLSEPFTNKWAHFGAVDSELHLINCWKERFLTGEAEDPKADNVFFLSSFPKSIDIYRQFQKRYRFPGLYLGFSVKDDQLAQLLEGMNFSKLFLPISLGLTSKGYEAIAKMTSLTHLFLAKAKKGDYTSFSNLTNLEELHINQLLHFIGGDYEKADLSFLPNLKKLRVLNCDSGNVIFAQIPESVKCLRLNPENVASEKEKLDTSFIAHVEELAVRAWYTFDFTNFWQKLPIAHPDIANAVTNSKVLKKLSLHHCTIYDEFFKLASNPNIEELDFSECNFIEADVQKLAEFKHLKKLTIDGCWVKEEVDFSFLKGMPNLTDMSVNATSANWSTFSAISSTSCTKLHCMIFTQEDLEHLLSAITGENAQKLTDLRLSVFAKDSEELDFSPLSKLTGLKNLEIDTNAKVKLAGKTEFSTLQSLSLRFLRNPQEIVEQFTMPKLNSARVLFCQGSVFLDTLEGKCPLMKKYVMFGTEYRREKKGYSWDLEYLPRNNVPLDSRPLDNMTVREMVSFRCNSLRELTRLRNYSEFEKKDELHMVPLTKTKDLDKLANTVFLNEKLGDGTVFSLNDCRTITVSRKIFGISSKAWSIVQQGNGILCLYRLTKYGFIMRQLKADYNESYFHVVHLLAPDFNLLTSLDGVPNWAL